MKLEGKKILLGVTGSIAAYKAAFVIRQFVKEGAEVRVVMTQAATEFISPLTLATLSKNEVLSTYVGNAEKGTWNNHVDLALWADVLLIAPATANTLAKMVTGVTDNLLQAVFLSAKCDVFFAPAMDLDMYQHPSTKHNLAVLAERGNTMIAAQHGELASGLVGEGRMAEPEDIVESIINYFDQNLPLRGQEFLITAGPTYEAIDPVRFIGNHSSGKMGVALAKAALNLGANVTLVSGPGVTQISHSCLRQINVTSAADMFDAVTANFKKVNVAIMAAAVADYSPKQQAQQKIKKDTAAMQIELSPTVDILKHCGKIKSPQQKLIGFALETENEEANAKKKIQSKNLDFIVLNSLNDKGAGFGTDTNKITIIDKHNNVLPFELASKEQVAINIIQEIQRL